MGRTDLGPRAQNTEKSARQSEEYFMMRSPKNASKLPPTARDQSARKNGDPPGGAGFAVVGAHRVRVGGHNSPGIGPGGSTGPSV